jgi:hypothetical protein
MRGGEVPVPLLFATAAFLSSFLLFCVQPMLAKMVLPQFGGAPAVWNTCMVFFQAALLAGYGYAHVASRRLGDRRCARLHLGLLALAVVALPIAVSEGGSIGGDPVLRLMLRLLAAAGLPLFVVATTAPLLQRWFAATAGAAAGCSARGGFPRSPGDLLPGRHGLPRRAGSAPAATGVLDGVLPDDRAGGRLGWSLQRPGGPTGLHLGGGIPAGASAWGLSHVSPHTDGISTWNL